jgi:hypothetical protein
MEIEIFDREQVIIKIIIAGVMPALSVYNGK